MKHTIRYGRYREFNWPNHALRQGAFASLVAEYRRQGFTLDQAVWNTENDRDNGDPSWRMLYERAR